MRSFLLSLFGRRRIGSGTPTGALFAFHAQQVLSHSTGIGQKAVPRFSEFCCCCLPLPPGLAYSIHPTWGPPFGRAPYACHSFPLLILSLPQLVVDGLVEPDAHAGHLLEHPLPPEALQPVDLQLRVPDVLQALGRDVYLLEDGRMIL